MAARDGAASVQGEVIRITPLHTDGSIDTTKPVLTTSGFISASFGQEFEDGDEITEKAANGAICIQYKADDSMKGITFNLSLCSPDPEAAALLAGGKVICDPATGEIIGYSSPKVGDIVGNPVAVEIWSKAIVGGKPAAGTPYWHWVFPYVRVRFDGDREFSNGALSNEFSGTGVGNEALVGTGLPGDYGPSPKFAPALANPFSYVRSAALPTVGWSGSFTPTGDNSIGCVGVQTDIHDQTDEIRTRIGDTLFNAEFATLVALNAGPFTGAQFDPIAEWSLTPADPNNWWVTLLDGSFAKWDDATDAWVAYVKP